MSSFHYAYYEFDWIGWCQIWIIRLNWENYYWTESPVALFIDLNEVLFFSSLFTHSSSMYICFQFQRENQFMMITRYEQQIPWICFGTNVFCIICCWHASSTHKPFHMIYKKKKYNSNTLDSMPTTRVSKK